MKDLRAIFRVAERQLGKALRVALFTVLAPQFAFAQTSSSGGTPFSGLQTTLQNIVATLNVAGVAVITIAVAWAGYRMIFQHTRWADIAMIVLGAVLVGFAGIIAQWLI